MIKMDSKQTIEAVVAQFIKKNLRFKVERVEQSPPNTRHITVMLGDDRVTSFKFDVYTQSEYDPWL